jgi:DNA-binding transcriptional ArsR family regulator
VGISGVTAEVYEHLQRMARVLASPLRIKIMVALGVRPMSPKMLEEELVDDGYSARTIDKHLHELKRSGWVELAGTATGGARRGAVEHLYCAVRLPIFDDVTWPALPLAMREMVTWRAFETLGKYLQHAWGADALDARDDRHVTCTPGLVDQVGWDVIIRRVDGFFASFLEEMQSAAFRLADSGEQPIPTMVALACFESPRERFTHDPSCRGSLVDTSAALSKHAFALRMAKAMIHPLRLLILNELSTRAMSAKMFFEQFGGREVEELAGEAITRSEVYRAFRILREFDWLVLVDTKSRGKGRRGREQFYRAVRPPILGSRTWPVLPESVNNGATGQALNAWADRMGEAMQARTMDARDDRHFTWTLSSLDRLGWDRTIERVDELRGFVHDEVKSAAIRLEESGEQPIPMTVALAVVESAVASTRVEPGPPFA